MNQDELRALDVDSEALFASRSLAVRNLTVRRIGLPSVSPPVVAARMRTPVHAATVLRRLEDHGSGRLLRLLVELGGGALARRDELELDASRLRGWFPWEETETTWTIGADVAAAMAPGAVWERFSVITLLARMDDPTLFSWARRMGVATSWARGAVVRDLARLLVASDAPLTDEVRAGAERAITERRVRADLIEQIAPIEGTGGRVFSLVVKGLGELRVTPREIAAGLGLPVAEVELERVKPTTAVAPAPIRLPSWARVGGLLTFSTARIADDAMRVDDFREVVLYRLDERRIVTRDDCEPRRALQILAQHGIRDTSEADSDARD